MLIVGQRVKLSDGIYRVKEVDSFKAKLVQEEVEVREFTTRWDKKVKIKSKPKVKFISPNAELKIKPDKPVNSKPPQKVKPPSDKIKIVKRKAVPKSKSAGKPPVKKVKLAAAKKKTAPVKKVKVVAAKKISKPVKKSKQVVSKKTTPPPQKKKQTVIKKVTEPVKKLKHAVAKKIILPVIKSKQVVEKPDPKPDKFGQFSLF